MVLHLPLFFVCYDYNFRKGKADKFVFADWFMVKVKEIINYAPKSKIKAGDAVSNGKYMFFTSSVDENKRYSEYQIDGEGIIMGTGGNATLHYYNGKFSTSTDCIVLQTNENVRCKYLYYFFLANMNVLEAGFKGAGLKHTNKNYIGDISIKNIPDTNAQDFIIRKLSKIEKIITHFRTQLEKLDLLVKARFVEMFGDTEYNTKKFPVYKLSELCTVSSSKRIYQDEQSSTGVPFLRISNLVELIETGHLKNELFISDEKYIELVRNNLVPQKGDILVTSRGTLGKCYIVQDDDKFYFQDGMISWLYNLNKAITPLYLALLFNTRNIKTQIDNLQSGSTVAYLSITMLKKLNIVVPPLTLQNQFADFVKQVDQSKSILQQELDKAQMLFDSLMQEYFG